MKMFNINGEIVKVDIRPSTYPMRGVSKSKLQSLCGQFLQDTFPRESILEEFTIPGSRMSVDFFLPLKRIVIECDGIQHDNYVPFFHKDRKTSKKYALQRQHDLKKNQWADLNAFKMIRIYNEEDILDIKV